MNFPNINSIYTAPRDLVLGTMDFASRMIHSSAGPAGQLGNSIVNMLTNPEFNSPAAISTVALTCLAGYGLWKLPTFLWEGKNYIYFDSPFKAATKYNFQMLSIDEILKGIQPPRPPTAPAAAGAGVAAAGGAAAVVPAAVPGAVVPAAVPGAVPGAVVPAAVPAAVPAVVPPNSNTSLLGLKIETTKPPEGQIRLRFPLTEDDLVINHKKIREVLSTEGKALCYMTIGALGVVDSLCSTEMFGEYGQCSQEQLGGNLPYAAAAIGKMLRIPLEITVKGLNIITKYNPASYGLGNLAASSILSYGGYRVMSGGVNLGFYKTDGLNLKWFKFSAKAPESKIKFGTIGKDLTKVASGITLISLGILSLNAFLSGNRGLI